MDVAFHSKMEQYYQKFVELQEKLKKSEEERMELEIRFNEMLEIAKEEEQAYYRKLRAQYKRFLEEDKRRQERNEKIMRNLERVETRITMLSAKTERLNVLRTQYQNYLWRIANTSKRDFNDVNKSFISKEVPFCSTSAQNLVSPKSNHAENRVSEPIKIPEIKLTEYANKETNLSNEETLNMLDKYLQNISSQKYLDVIETERKRHKLSLLSQNFVTDSNQATSIADDIMGSIYSKYYGKSNAASKSFSRGDHENQFPKRLTSNEKHESKHNLYTREHFGINKDGETVPNQFPNAPNSSKHINFHIDANEGHEENESNDYSQSECDSQDAQNPNVLGNENMSFKSTGIAKHVVVKRNTDYENELAQIKSDSQLGEETQPQQREFDDKINQLPAVRQAKLANENIEDLSNNARTETAKEPQKESESNALKSDQQEREPTIKSSTVISNNATVANKSEMSGFSLTESSNDIEKPKQFDHTASHYNLDNQGNDIQNQVPPIFPSEPIDLDQNIEKPTQHDQSGSSCEVGKQNQEHEVQNQVQNISPVERPLNGDDQNIRIPTQHEKPAPYYNVDNEKQENDLQNQVQDVLPTDEIKDYDQNIQKLTQHDQLASYYNAGNQDQDHDIQNQVQYISPTDQTNDCDQNTQKLTQEDQSASYYNVDNQNQEYDLQNQVQYDENNQPIQYDYSQYDEYGQPLLYDQHGQLVEPQYDENGQLIQQYDENGQLIALYDQNGQDVFGGMLQQYDENGVPYYPDQGGIQDNQELQQHIDPTQYYGKDSEEFNSDTSGITKNEDNRVKIEEQAIMNENAVESARSDTVDDVKSDDQFQITAENPKLDKEEVLTDKPVSAASKEDGTIDQRESVPEPSNVMEMLDTDTDSIKHNISKISNDSDFDFS